MLLQGLTVQVPKIIYVTIERSKPAASRRVKQPLLQENVDAAFSKPQKLTASFAAYNGTRIYLLNGQYTGQLGVYTEEGTHITNLERTLLKYCTSRP